MFFPLQFSIMFIITGCIWITISFSVNIRFHITAESQTLPLHHPSFFPVFILNRRRKLLHISGVTSAKPKGTSSSISFSVKVLLCLRQCVFTTDHANSIGLNSQWAVGKRTTSWPYFWAIPSVLYTVFAFAATIFEYIEVSWQICNTTFV